jgi:hypothetical protein
MKRLHPEFEKVQNESGVCHHMVFNKFILDELFQKVESHHSKKTFWKAFLDCVDPREKEKSGASEYEIYFNYLLKFHRERVLLRSLPFSNWEQDVNLIPEGLSEYYVNHHWWTEPKDRFTEVEKSTLEMFSKREKSMIVLVFLGTIPTYTRECVQQIRTWSNLPIYFITDARSQVEDILYDWLNEITIVDVDSLPQTQNLILIERCRHLFGSLQMLVGRENLFYFSLYDYNKLVNFLLNHTNIYT